MQPLVQLLEAGHPGPVTVTVTKNRSRVLSWLMRGDELRVRVARHLLAHPEDVAAAVLHRDPGAMARIRQRPGQGPRRQMRLSSQGEAHDLKPLLEQAQRLTPEVTELPPVGWGRWPSRPPTRSIRLGWTDGNRIVLHPVLDHRSVPQWVLRFILFHELLHIAVPPTRRGGRRIVHGRLFRIREARHPDYARYQAWKEEHLVRLLRRCAQRAGGA